MARSAKRLTNEALTCAFTGLLTPLSKTLTSVLFYLSSVPYSSIFFSFPSVPYRAANNF